MGLFGRVAPAPGFEPIKAFERWWEGQPSVDGVDLGDVRRVRPISRAFATDRGQAIDHYYLERFLDSCLEDVRGRELEIGDDTYTRRYGGEKVEHSDMLHVHDRNPRATIVGDLNNALHVPDNSFDCIILTQTPQFVFDLPGAMRTLSRTLVSGGILLLTVPGMSQVAADSEWGKTWYWAFTGLAVERLLREVMQASNITVAIHGNVLAATAFLHGLATSELTAAELNAVDPDYQLLITARAVKGAAPL